MEQYGRDGEFTRIVGVPEDLAAHWSKRRAAIVDAANDMGFKVEGNAARAAAANKITRAGKSPDNDPGGETPPLAGRGRRISVQSAKS